MHSETSVYPSEYETEAILKDGSRLRLRPIRREDADAWVTFVSKLSLQTEYFRFHGVGRKWDREDALRFCTVDYKDTFALVAEVLIERHWHIVAIGRYYRLPRGRTAQIALVVADQYQGKGIGTKLLEALCRVARDNGIADFEGDVLAENQNMMAMLKDYGFHITSELRAGAYHVRFPIAPTARVARKEEDRERSATLASLRYVLSPRSVAVIGASRQPGTIGNLLLKCILDSGFSGTVYPVNPNAAAVTSVKAYPSVLDVPNSVELAVIAVPASVVAEVVDECGRKGVRAIIVISDGFSERGPEGARREEELREITLGYGMRLIGPNCMGVINTDPAIRLNATFSPVYPPRGSIAFLSQSGALGLAILNYVNELNIGISSFVSVGNRADISSNDLLQYWQQDPTTRVILLYLESFGNPRKFGRIARRVSPIKPIVAMKAGRTWSGSQLASSTGAVATPQTASEALFRQAGIIRVDTLEELFNVAILLSHQPLPKGRRVAVVTNGRGPGILAADACGQLGLALPEFPEDTQQKLRSVMKRDTGLSNPLDLTAQTTVEEFEGVLKTLASDMTNDAAIAIFVPPVAVDREAMGQAVGRAARFFRRYQKPLVACFMGERGFKAKLGYEGNYVPCYPFPEDAASALARAVAYSEWRKRPKGVIPRFTGLKKARARKVIEAGMSRSVERPLWLSDSEVAELLNCYGIRLVETRTADTALEAAAAAAQIGFPVAVKLASSTIVPKPETGGVVIDVRSEDEVIRAFESIRARLAEVGREGEMEGVKVQRLVTGGIEAIISAAEDPSFGPLIMFGMGGIYTELLKDVAVRLHPLTDLDAEELVSSIRMAKLFQGYGRFPPSDVAALKDLLLRLSALLEDIPEIAELSLNPVKVMPEGEGYWIVDAAIMVK
ncbi:MAG: bifunctional acetate--CoA ligase family protein/GNAT family N-acetyltransferase [Dehalococcoidia bacterium]